MSSIFDLPAKPSQTHLVPVFGSLQEIIDLPDIEYVIVDLDSSQGRLDDVEAIRSARPGIRLIVIGPEGDDELVLKSIIAGARGYLGFSAGPEIMRRAIDEVTAGSIWAPRQLLTRLIDRLLQVPDATPIAPPAQLTPREEQVLKLILMAQSTREIARQLGIEQRTVKAYVGRLMRKTGADNRVKLSISALGQSLLGAEKGERHRGRPHERGVTD
jgi:DNA-binding NarL/FixJ family response regulator